MKKITLEKAVRETIDKHGGVRAAARALGVSPAYISKLSHGLREEPSARFLQMLGIARNVTYTRL